MPPTETVEDRGGAERVKADAGELKDVAAGEEGVFDKAKDGAEAIRWRIGGVVPGRSRGRPDCGFRCAPGWSGCASTTAAPPGRGPSALNPGSGTR